MPIYIDISAAVHSKAGIGRYAESLAGALAARYPEDIGLFFNRIRGSQVPAGLESMPSRSVRTGYKPWRMSVWLGHRLGFSFDRLMPDATLFHATEHLLPPLQNVPTVLTVHDLIFKLFPEHQKRLNYWYLNAAMPLFCRRADAIITVSQWSKKDLMTGYGLDSSKVTVIPEAAAPEFAPLPLGAVDQIRKRYGLPDKYVLHVGTIEPRKNLTRLIEALQVLRDEGLRIPLVVAGRKGWLYDDFFARLQQLDVQDSVLFPGFVPSADLPLLYNAATMVVMPSIYEGFGLPVVEAQACGTPVVCSNASSLPELGGEAALYFDPYDHYAMADALRTVWTDADLRAQMGCLGLERAGRFSWARAAAETMALYQSLLD